MGRLGGLIAIALVACTSAGPPERHTPSDPPREHQMNATASIVPAARSDATCDAVPIGALEPARPVWCHAARAAAPPTAISGRSVWIDEFRSATEHGAMPRGYRVFEAGAPSFYRSIHFAHNGHWMVDIKSLGVAPGRYVGAPPDLAEPSDFGGALMRPDQSFRAEGGRLVIEADTSAGMEAYVDAWPEIVVTTAPEPTSVIEPRFTYGVFGGHPALGCRFEKDRVPVCAVFGPDGLLFEMAHDRTPGGTIAGGRPIGPLASAWRLCRPADPDAQCRDRFRLEVEPGRLALIVNETPYMEHRLSGARLPAELFERDVYVYFASWLYQPTPAVVRFHWGRLAINP